MKTTIYLIRHSEPMKNIININNNDNLQIINEKNSLSVKGEKNAEKLSLNKEMQDIDVVISSNYVRAISTAKYIAHQNNLHINIMEEFNERKYGIDSWDEKPKNFDQNQITDKYLKMPNGESQIEVADRMYNGLMKVLKENNGKSVAIVSHATAITFLLMNLGTYKDSKIYFNNQLLMDENFVWNAPEVFKLEFNNNDLIKIENKKW